MAHMAAHPCIALFHDEIQRFRRFARQRSTRDRVTRRRRHKRYHRSWPLLVATYRSGALVECSAALHDASPGGIGFMCERSFEPGTQIFIRLFWHEATALRIPAIVRHIARSSRGVLVGSQFDLNNVDACEAALHMDAVCRL